MTGKDGRFLTIDVEEDGVTGALQVYINEEAENGAAHGHQLAGPPCSGTGRVLLTRRLTERDAQAIRFYLDLVFPIRGE